MTDESFVKTASPTGRTADANGGLGPVAQRTNRPRGFGGFATNNKQGEVHAPPPACK